MEKDSSVRQSGSSARPREPFVAGAVVIATLCNPREKFWWMILSLAAEGLTPAVVFSPMHRIERVELDLPDGSLPSLSQRFLAKTGLEPTAALTPSNGNQPTAGSDLPNSPSHVSKDRA